MKEINPSIFRAYDVRGLYPREINERVVYAVAQAYAKIYQPKEVVLGRDVRLSSPELARAAEKGFTEAGVDVVDIGTVTTDLFYFAVAYGQYPGGMVITGSHNPKEYNGVKIVREKAYPVGAGSGMEEIRDQVTAGEKLLSKKPGTIQKRDFKPEYLEHVLTFIDKSKIKKLKLVANTNHGAAGEIVKDLAKKLNIVLAPMNFQPDGNFPVPQGRPDPLIPENSAETAKKIVETEADFGVAWDSDADRCFFLDEHGKVLPAYYTTAILAEYLLRSNSGGKIVYDPRLTWAIKDVAKEAGGEAILSKAGHAYIKQMMRKEKALFGGETSGHYYFQKNFYADNGMIPFVLMLELISTSGKKISEIYKPFQNKYFISGEINFEIKEADKLLAELENGYKDAKIDKIDGLSVEYDNWRANIRASNTEPLVRLNIEARDQKTVDEKVKEIGKIVEKYK